jgi:hypothetical protein
MPMKKHLNVDQIQSELRGGSAFFPGYIGGSPPPAASQEAEEVTAETSTRSQSPPAPRQDTQKATPRAVPARAYARTPVRPNGKRIITRNSFEIYEDQMAALRQLSLQDKMEGKLGSMSQMVRDAIDTYLANKAPQK